MDAGSGPAGVDTEVTDLAEMTFSGGEFRTGLREWRWGEGGDRAWCSECHDEVPGSGWG